MAKMNVKDTEITVVQINNEDYLCLTDMIKAKDGDFFITDWLRNRNIILILIMANSPQLKVSLG